MSFTKIDHYEKEYADTHHDTALWGSISSSGESVEPHFSHWSP